MIRWRACEGSRRHSFAATKARRRRPGALSPLEGEKAISSSWRSQAIKIARAGWHPVRTGEGSRRRHFRHRRRRGKRWFPLSCLFCDLDLGKPRPKTAKRLSLPQGERGRPATAAAPAGVPPLHHRALSALAPRAMLGCTPGHDIPRTHAPETPALCQGDAGRSDASGAAVLAGGQGRSAGGAEVTAAGADARLHRRFRLL